MRKNARVALIGDPDPWRVVEVLEDRTKYRIRKESGEDEGMTDVVDRDAMTPWTSDHSFMRIAERWIGQRVVIRDHSAGVYWGILDFYDLKERKAVLREARQAYFWEGAAATPGLAARGPKGGQIGPLVDITCADVVALIPCTDEANEAWAKQPEWKP